jgi:hypothetical protein
MYGTVTQIQVTPDQLTELVRGAVRQELANYTPPAPVGAELPDLLTRKEVAKYLRVSLTTLHEWAKDTDDRAALLVPQTINGRVRYRRDDVLRLQQEHRRFKTSVAGRESREVC